MVPQKLTFSHAVKSKPISPVATKPDAGLLLFREVDKQHRLTQRLANVLLDQCDSSHAQHQLDIMNAQRVCVCLPIMET